ncbi:NAD-dependent epimerase [Candidatus Pantoea carbekii]|uniref:NAD-dependent epimerase n=1 Tax=Candidatus Pantoea carbekii TaxID=1235990 RepID=UPI0006187690|nr:NAD-dependent epimerase [Candidatus Pantoea carbekii]AKC32059.1 DTDP-glucose 4 6-dehydratase RfbB [Candidatus Pantoea carbekii]
MKFLITGSAGFIGFHISKRLLDSGHQVIGIDNLNDYYDVSLKKARLNQIIKYSKFTFIKMDLIDSSAISCLFSTYHFDRVIHLGAQAGVRYSIDHPNAYANSNLIGHLNILEACRHNKIEHLIYASSSSVYGLNNKLPFSTDDKVDHPISLYAATKKANELMSHAYSHLYKLPTTGLRFFTVYGPWGRPDMAVFKFTRSILEGKQLHIYNHGHMKRDFTYIDDVVDRIIYLIDVIPQQNKNWTVENGPIGSSSATYHIYNIGNTHSVSLITCINLIEKAVGMKAKKNMLPMQPGDILQTSADMTALQGNINFQPYTNLEEGIKKFVDWYRKFYHY